MSKTNANQDVMAARVRELIETGKQKGVLTYKEIVETLGDVELSPEQFDRILDTLSGLNIEVIKEDAMRDAEDCLRTIRQSRESAREEQIQQEIGTATPEQKEALYRQMMAMMNKADD